MSAGKLTLDRPVGEFVRQHLTAASLDQLHPTLDDILAIATLAHHYRDPIDRLLISQSLTQHIPLISADSQFDAYGVERIW